MEINNKRETVVKIVFFIVAAVVTALPGIFALFSIFSVRSIASFILRFQALIIITLIAGYVGFINAKHLIKRAKNNIPIIGLVFRNGLLFGGLCGALANIPIYLVFDNGFFIPFLIFALPVGAIIGAIAGLIGTAIAFNIARAYLRGGQRSFS